MLPRKKVIHATVSPLNGMRWICKLECGHEAWVTQGKKPRLVACLSCGAEDAARKRAARNKAGSGQARKEETPSVHEPSSGGNLESDGSKLGGLGSSS